MIDIIDTIKLESQDGFEYRATAYSNPYFQDTNLAKLKTSINKYLNS